MNQPLLKQARPATLTRIVVLSALVAMLVMGTFAPRITIAAAADATCPVSPTAKLTWIPPRGTLEVMDDYPLWVAKKLGYFDQLGVDVNLQPAPTGGASTMSLLTEKQADVGYPSPGVLTSAIDAGIPVILGWEMVGGQVFDFAIREDSDIKSVKDLAGKTISMPAAGLETITNPILAEQGIDVSTVKYVNAGNQWGQSVIQGQADAALAWEGLRAQWLSQGLKLKFLIGSEFSKDPSNGYAIRAADLKDEAATKTLTCFFRGVAMGMEFARLNPQAAAQITYEQFPALKDQMTPDLALESLRQLGYLYNQSNKAGHGYGYSDETNWQSYLDRIFKLGQTKTGLKVADTVTNAFVKPANDFDKAKVAADAKAFVLNDAWKAVKLQGPIE